MAEALDRVACEDDAAPTQGMIRLAELKVKRDFRPLHENTAMTPLEVQESFRMLGCISTICRNACRKSTSGRFSIPSPVGTIS
jgi:hypothetical protein